MIFGWVGPDFFGMEDLFKRNGRAGATVGHGSFGEIVWGVGRDETEIVIAVADQDLRR
jgi:hypothetical protein